MTKYTSNEQYEKDKNLAIAFCENTVIERTSDEIKRMKWIVGLLNQSKWIGLQNEPQKISYNEVLDVPDENDDD